MNTVSTCFLLNPQVMFKLVWVHFLEHFCNPLSLLCSFRFSGLRYFVLPVRIYILISHWEPLDLQKQFSKSFQQVAVTQLWLPFDWCSCFFFCLERFPTICLDSLHSDAYSSLPRSHRTLPTCFPCPSRLDQVPFLGNLSHHIS